MRRTLPNKLDSDIFRTTASSGKKINLGSVTYRGGIRF